MPLANGRALLQPANHDIFVEAPNCATSSKTVSQGDTHYTCGAPTFLSPEKQQRFCALEYSLQCAHLYLPLSAISLASANALDLPLPVY